MPNPAGKDSNQLERIRLTAFVDCVARALAKRWLREQRVRTGTDEVGATETRTNAVSDPHRCVTPTA